MASTPSGKPITVRARLLNSATDIPAQHDMSKMMHHGGAHSCFACKLRGMKFPSKRYSYPIMQRYEGRKFNLSYREESEVQSIYAQMKQQHGRNPLDVPIWQGLRSIPIFTLLSYWRFTLFATIDFMHLFEGIFKTLVSLWTQAKYSKTGRALISKKDWLKWESDCLLKQAIPEVFGRSVRSVYENWKFFKATECVIFLLYTSRLLKYLFPIDSEHYRHHMKVVDSLYALLQPSPKSKASLIAIHTNLYEYVIDYQRIYGHDMVTMNIHLLIHLVWCVFNHGPLDEYSCFPFEGFNKMILGSIHGTYRVERGLADSIPIFQYLHERLAFVQDASCIKALKRMKCRVLDSKSDKVTIEMGQRNAMAFGRWNAKNGCHLDPNHHYYKYVRIDGILFEARGLVKDVIRTAS